MKNYVLTRWAALVSLACCCASCRSPQSSPKLSQIDDEVNERTRVSSCDVGGKNYFVTLSTKDLRGTPHWNIAQGKEPSVLPGQAVLLAKQELKRTFPNLDGWTVQSITLHSDFFRAVQAVQSDRWFYEIVFAPPLRQQRFGTWESFFIFVLSDGTVVGPKDSGIDDATPGK
jgi:hypothetical protein